MSIKIALIVGAIVVFALACGGVPDAKHFQLVPFGLALFAASFLPV